MWLYLRTYNRLALITPEMCLFVTYITPAGVVPLVAGPWLSLGLICRSNYSYTLILQRRLSIIRKRGGLLALKPSTLIGPRGWQTRGCGSANGEAVFLFLWFLPFSYWIQREKRYEKENKGKKNNRQGKGEVGKKQKKEEIDYIIMRDVTQHKSMIHDP